MGDLRVCRFCLIMDVKMSVIEEHKIDSFAGTNLSMSLNLPPYSCYECTALLDKVSKFIEKCTIAQAILCSILERNDKITENEIRCIDRKAVKLESTMKLCAKPLIISRGGWWCKKQILGRKNSSDKANETHEKKASDFDAHNNLLISNSLENKTGLNDINKSEIVTEENDVLMDLGLDSIDNEGSSSENEKSDINLNVCNYIDDIEMDETEIKQESERISFNLAEMKGMQGSGNCHPKVEDTYDGHEIPLQNTESSNINRQVGSNLESSDDEDNLPLKIITKNVDLQNKQTKTKRVNGEKKQKLNKNAKKSSVLCTRNRRSNRNEDGLTEEEVSLLKDFDVIKLTLVEQLAEFAKRKESGNYKAFPFKCELCYKGFLLAKTLDNHSKLHDPIFGQFECPICKRRFKLHCNRARHMLQTHGTKYMCKACQFQTTHPHTAKLHKMWHLGVTYECKLCGEISQKKTSHLSHMRIKHPSEFICDICGYSFLGPRGLQQHKAMMHKDTMLQTKNEEEQRRDQDSNLYCVECDVQFRSQQAWTRHLVTSAKHNSLPTSTGCRDCGERFASATELRVHRRQHEASRYAAQRLKDAQVKDAKLMDASKDPDGYPAKCEHCDEMMEGRKYHWIHYQTFHRDKKYPHSYHTCICDVCGKGFKNNANLKMHALTHQEKKYQCDECSKWFHIKKHVLNHLKCHQRQPEHACVQCGKVLKTKVLLNQHVKGQHDGPKPFPCQYCGKRFTRGSVRSVHVKEVHHGLRKKRTRKPKRKLSSKLEISNE